MSDLKIDYGDLHSLVEEGRGREKERAARTGVLRRGLARTIRTLVLAVVLAVLPFFVLVRGGVFAYREWGVGTWPALALAGVATALLLSAYGWLMGRRLGGGRGVRRLLMRAGSAVAVAWVAYALVYVSAGNLKGEGLREEYRSLHPLLRVAASSVFLADGETVMTDASRTPEDYWLMGLPVNEASLHFSQDDGFVHALDLRTRGRREWRNRGLEMAFWALGFHTLRHVGTADHLHVSLRPPR